MHRSEEYFNQLRFCSDIEELRRETDRLIALGNFESVAAIRHYFLHTPIKEIKTHIVKKITELDDLKSKFRLLVEFSYTNDKELKIEILNGITKIKHPIFSHRLFSIYSHTDSDTKKIAILKIFITTGISLFKENFLSHFEEESIKVKEYILAYLVNTPFLSEENCRRIISLVGNLLSHETQLSKADEGKLLYNLWMLSMNNPNITKEAKKVLQKSHHDYSLFYYLYEVVAVDEKKHPSNSKVIQSLYENDSQTIHQVRFSRTFIKGFLPSLEKKLLDIEKDFHARDNQFIWRLLYLNHEEITNLLIDIFNRSSHFNFKQSLLDVLSFFDLNEGLKERLKPLCLHLFEDKEHIRIFESLTRSVIVLFSHEGLKIVYNRYESLKNIDQRIQVLSGIIHALMDFGLGRGLRALDNYTLNMILGNSVDFAISSLPVDQDAKKSNTQYVSKIFQIINLLKIDTYVDEMIILAEKYGITLEVLTSLLSLNNEKISDFVQNKFNVWSQNEIEYKYKIQLFLYELSRRRIKGMENLPKDTMQFLLEQPTFTADVIRYCQKYDRQDLIPITLNLHTIKALHIQYNLIDLMKNHPKWIKDEIVEAMYQKGDSFIKRKIAPLIMTSHNVVLVKKIYNFFVSEAKDIKELLTMIKHVPLKENNIKSHLQIIDKLEQKIIPEHFVEIKNALAEHLYFYVFCRNKEVETISSNEGRPLAQSNPNQQGKEKFPVKSHKPIDEVSTPEMKQALYTAEHLQQFFTDQINREANLDTLDIDTVTSEYKKFIFLGYKNYLLEKIPGLLQNTDFIEGVFKVFPKASYYHVFIKQSKHFNQADIKLEQIENWVNVIDSITKASNKIDNIAQYIKSLDDLVHLYAMLLHQNNFYSINNPLNVDLDYFHKNNIINLLSDFNHFAFTGDDFYNKGFRSINREINKQNALEYIKKLREKAKILAGFLLTLER